MKKEEYVKEYKRLGRIPISKDYQPMMVDEYEMRVIACLRTLDRQSKLYYCENIIRDASDIRKGKKKE